MSTHRRIHWYSVRHLPTIGVDCDGVLASDRQLWQRLQACFPEHIPARYDDLATFEWPRVTAETAALCLELSADPAFAERLQPMAGMARGLRQLRATGYRIQLITARPACVRAATWRWLRRYGVADYVEDVHCVAGGPDKVPLALGLGCAAFVEDNYATAEAMGAAGIRAYLFDAPYNRLPAMYSTRVAGWQALLDDLFARPLPHGRTLQLAADDRATEDAADAIAATLAS
jgi:uncharacterized HAD superfamily protein